MANPCRATPHHCAPALHPPPGKVSDWSLGPCDPAGRGGINATQPQRAFCDGCKIKVRCIYHDQDNPWCRLHDIVRRPFSSSRISLPEGRRQPAVWLSRLSKLILAGTCCTPPFISRTSPVTTRSPLSLPQEDLSTSSVSPSSRSDLSPSCILSFRDHCRRQDNEFSQNGQTRSFMAPEGARPSDAGRLRGCSRPFFV